MKAISTAIPWTMKPAPGEPPRRVLLRLDGSTRPADFGEAESFDRSASWWLKQRNIALRNIKDRLQWP